MYARFNQLFRKSMYSIPRIFLSSCRTDIYFYYSHQHYFKGVRDRKVLPDQKSEQKNCPTLIYGSRRTEIIPAFTRKAFRMAASYSSLRDS